LNPMDYRQKLMQFNSSNKYLIELDFLNRLLNASVGEKILDFGCGIGTAVTYNRCMSISDVYGYDVHTYCSDKHWYVDTIPKDISKAYFMHSIAHIQYIENTLRKLVSLVKNEVIVITPNKKWLENQDPNGYIPDPTVINHFYLDELEKLFTECGYSIRMSGQFGEEINNVCERIFLVAKPIR
jgi:hypothetical protein